MSQISPPIRILLIGAVVFMAAWFTVLKPKPADTDPAASAAAPAAPGTPDSKAGEFAAKAEAGAATAESSATGAANAGVEGTTAAPATTTTAAPATTSTSATATAGAPTAAPLAELKPEALKGLPASLRDALEERKVVVLGVLNTRNSSVATMADDDRAVRNVLDEVNRYDGGVVVRTAPIARLAKYDGLLQALDVTQSPTVVVVDRTRRAVALEGYVDRGAINQAIADARDTSVARRIKDPYLRDVNTVCGQTNLLGSRVSVSPTVRGGERRLAATRLAKAKRMRSRFARLDPPKRWRKLDREIARFLAADVRLAQGVVVAARRGLTPAVRASRRYDAAIAARGPALDRRFNAVGLTACASNRTR